MKPGLQYVASGHKSRKFGLFLGALLGAFAVLLLVSPHARAQGAGPCPAPPEANEIVVENCKPGDPASEWDIQGAGDTNIQGFATDISVNRGKPISFKIDTTASEYDIPIYRLGYYDGDGARKVDTIPSTEVTATDQEPCNKEDIQMGGGATTSGKLLDCGNWSESATWQVPADATSGVYIARPTRTDTGGASHIVFIVRDDASTSDLVFQTSDTTWQSYNPYGGYNAYGSSGATMAEKLSYNRPFTTRGAELENWLFNGEYPMIRWLERNGFDTSYISAVDTERNSDLLTNHDAFLSVGHDEYWSQGRRDAVTDARDAGVDLAFFSANEIYWKTRWENSNVNDQAYRTQVVYKEGSSAPSGSAEHRNCYNRYDCDPTDVWTGQWREEPDSTPENSLSGQISWRLTTPGRSMKVPGEYAPLRFWRNTDIANLDADEEFTLDGNILGYEWDPEYPEYADSYPPGRVLLSETYETSFKGVPEPHHLSLYRAESGALVFGAGTVQWSWGLDATHDYGSSAEDPNVQQATVNLLADMGAQPAVLQDGLTAAQASTDTTAPISTIGSPADDATVEEDRPVTITGTASDGETGGVVGGVEVSVDGGQTWRRAEGREAWRYTWTPQEQGQATIKSRAVDDSVNLESPSAGRTVTVGPRAPATCPCTIWDSTTTPALSSEAKAYELGVKFRSDVDGYVSGVRFYKGPNNTGTHVGHLWKQSTQEQLAEATFTQETSSGWQEVRFASPVPITANTTYVASYHTNTGNYAFESGYFASSGVDNPPLHALQAGVDGGNGVFNEGGIAFPQSSFNSSNYGVDVVFETSVGPDTTPPTVQSVSPTDGQNGVNTNTTVSATFNEAMNSNTINPDTFGLRDDSNNVVSATVGYNPGTRTATLTPDAPLDNSKTYTATVKGGSGGVKDAAGNPLAEDKTWSFTTAAPPSPPPDEGPGGPILVITDSSDPFGRYYAEILRNEGLNEFTAKDISSVSAATLDDYDVAILGEMPLNASQAGMLGDWVDGGGNLVAMRPDSDLAGLLGLSNASGTLDNAYMKVDTAAAPGKGIVGETMQFHGTADRYSLGGDARAVATLYSGANTATQNPAVTVRDVGASGGQAAAFTYDLTKSVVYTRQGNPAWAGDERDGQSGPLRSDDLFYGAKAGDNQPDWVDLNKVAIPQADEQQRLLANLIGEMNLDKKPLPRFWYFPRGEEAVVVMTGDDHASGGTGGQFDWFKSQSPQGCSVDDWECIRGTSYIYTNTPLTNAQAGAYENEGFEVALHVDTGCNNWTAQSLATNYTTQLAAWKAKYTSANAPATNRTHCIAWSDWATQPKVELENGIRFDTNYYYWPAAWIQDRPGLFTGSGMPMRFADTDGKMVDVYQANTQLTDESGQNIPVHIKALIDKALGPEGYYGAFTTNMHTDRSNHTEAQAIVNEAKTRGVPVVSARQMLEWLDGRNASSFESMSWNDNELNFSVDVGAGANGLQAMVPVDSDDGKLTSLERGGNPVDYTKKTIKGVEYATFSAAAGSYEATYEADTTAPIISGLNATANADGTATISWTTDEPATSRVDYGTSPGTLDQSATEPGLATTHSVQLTGLQANTTYHYRVTSADAEDNVATSPQSADPPVSFETPEAGLTDTTTADFGGGTPGSGTYVSQTGNGEIILKPTVGEEFSGTSLPAGWQSGTWESDGGGAGGTATVSGGRLTVDGARANTDAAYAAGRSVEFVATFGSATFQTVGLASGLSSGSDSWAQFGTGNSNNILKARTNNGSQANDFDIPNSGSYIGTEHRYRIEWATNEVRFYVDGTLVHTQPVTIGAQMRPVASDFSSGGPNLSVDWMRMGPYQSPGTFESRVFDSETVATNWLDLNSTVQRPSGTNVAFETRSGESATPDGTWSAWEPVASDGTIASPDGRYIKYRANLSTNDQSVSPTVEQATLTYGEGAPDTTAPIISALNAAPAADGTATITWSTNESSTSQVDYGTSPGALTQSASDPTLTRTHSVGLTGLEAGTTYYYRVSSADGAGNLATSPVEGQDPAIFETPDAGFTDTTTAHFSAGTPGAVTYVVQDVDGEVILKPTVGEEFSGSSLPASWSGSPWTGGTATVSGGRLNVDGARAETDATYGPGRSLEFVATFGSATFQTVGLATDLSDFPGRSWIQFGTAGSPNTLSARINNDGTVLPDYVIPNSGSLIGTEHRYRIEWATNEVRFYVDGAQVHSQPVTVGAQMRPVVSDYSSGGPELSVDWMRMGPYASSGTFQSRVFDSTKNATDWRKLTSAAQKPTGTNVTFETRSGNTETPDGTWSGWQAVGTGDEISSPDNRYIQYRANLSTSDPSLTPSVEQVTLSYRLDKTPPAAPSKPDLTTASDSGSSDTDDVTNAATPTLNGIAEANSSVELFADGNSLGSTDAEGSGAWSFTPDEALADSTYQVTAKATDAAGNTSPASEALSLEIDTTGPDTSITSGPQGTTSSTSAELAFSSAEQGASFECKLDDAGYESCGSPKTYTGLDDGPHAFSVRAVDVAGNKDASPAGRNFTVDATRPDAPTITSPQNNTYDNDGNVEVSGTAEAGSTVELFEGTSLKGTDEADPDTGAWSIQLTSVQNGEHTYTAKARDEAGNASDASTGVKVIVDTVAPDASLTAPDEGTRVRGTVDLSADASDNAGVERVEFLVNGNVVGTDTSQPYGFDWDTSVVPDGSKAISARAFDLAGNQTTSTTRTVVVDNTAPAAPSRPDLTTDSGSDNADNLTNDTTPTLTGTAEEGATVRILVDGVEEGSAIATGGTYSITTDALGDGPHSVTAKATDATENEGTESEALDIIVDTQKPGAPTRVDLIAGSDNGSSNTDNVTNDNTPTFDVTAEADSTVRIFKGSDTTSLGSAQANGSGVASITSGLLADGDYTISATSEDAAGNVSDSSATLNVTVGTRVDTQPPTAPSKPDLTAADDSGSSDSDDVTNVVKPTFNGTAEADSSVELFADGTPIGTTNAGADGAWAFTPSGMLADGTYSVTAKATDGAGNTSQASAALSVEIDTAAPSTVLQLEATPSQAGIALDWAGNSELDLAGYNVYRAGSPTGTFNKLNNGLLTPSQYNDTQAPVGVDSYYRVTAVDGAGNESDPATRSARRPAPPETVKPSVSLGSTPAAGARVRGTVGLSATASDNTGVERVEFLVNGNVVGFDTSAPYSFDWDTTGVPDGSKTIAARAFDVYGNQRTTGVRTIVVDNTDPTEPPKPNLAAASDSGASDTDNVTRANGLTLNNGASTVEPKARVELFEGTSLKGTTRASSEGTWSIRLSDVASGAHDYKVKLTDVAGNSSPLSEELSVTVDRQLPTITDLAPAPGSTTSVRRPEIRANVEDNQAGGLAKSDVNLFVDNVAIGPNAFSYDTSTGRLLYEPPSNLSIARHTVRVVVTDKAGNQKSLSWTFRVVS